jgi:hypothetical protein
MNTISFSFLLILFLLGIWFLPYSIIFYGPHPMTFLLFWTWIFLPFLLMLHLCLMILVLSGLPVSPFFLHSYMEYCICLFVSWISVFGLVFMSMLCNIVHELNAYVFQIFSDAVISLRCTALPSIVSWLAGCCSCVRLRSLWIWQVSNSS